MIRLILVIIFLLLYFILGLPVLGVLWLIGKWNKPAADIASLRIVQWAFKVILFLCGTKLTVIGEENVPKDQPVLYIANHQSYFDIVVSYSRCPGLTGYIAKDGLEKVPILSIWMKRLYCLFLNRQDIKEGMKTILKGIDQIKHGISMCIFPEGTRNDNPKELLPFKEGSFKLALKFVTGHICKFHLLLLFLLNNLFQLIGKLFFRDHGKFHITDFGIIFFLHLASAHCRRQQHQQDS